MDGEKTPICYKEITTALRQWILPTFVSPAGFTRASVHHRGRTPVYRDVLLPVGKKSEDVDSPASVRAPGPPGGPEEPDQEETGQAAGLRDDRVQTHPELRGAGRGRHLQVDFLFFLSAESANVQAVCLFI